MKFVLFVEGETERTVLPAFLKRWLDRRVGEKVRIPRPVRFRGWARMVGELVKRAALYLDRLEEDRIVAVVGLLDLYGPTFYPSGATSVEERVAWATKELETRVGHDRFRMFFAVHELEAWLLSDPRIFPPAVRDAVKKKAKDPEAVNFNQPPSILLDRLYRREMGRRYQKVTDGADLFTMLDPEKAYAECPHLKKMLDEMLRMAKESEG